jgi:hypothetical protein
MARATVWKEQADEDDSTDDCTTDYTTDSNSSDDELVEHANLTNEIRTIPYPCWCSAEFLCLVTYD